MITPSSFEINFPSVREGEIVTIAASPFADISIAPAIMNEYGAQTTLAAGQVLYSEEKKLLRILSRSLMPATPEGKSPYTPHAIPCCYAKALLHIEQGKRTVISKKTEISLAWITLSDKASVGDRIDESGPAILEDVSNALPLAFSQGYLLPDAPDRLKSLVLDLAFHQGFDLIITTGGTGLGPRDTTPEALLPLLSRRLPGFEQAMMAVSLQKTPSACISRAFAGTLGESLLLSLPGSKKAVQENLAAILPAVFHAIEKLQGNTADCVPLAKRT